MALLYRRVYSSGIVRAPERERERQEAQQILREIPKTKDGVRKKNSQRVKSFWKTLWWDKICKEM